MKRIIIGIVIGSVIASLCFIPILLKERREEFANGRHQGEIIGKLEVWRFLDKHFRNDAQSSLPITDSLSVKDASIVVIEKQGILTIDTK